MGYKKVSLCIFQLGKIIFNKVQPVYFEPGFISTVHNDGGGQSTPCFLISSDRVSAGLKKYSCESLLENSYRPEVKK